MQQRTHNEMNYAPTEKREIDRTENPTGLLPIAASGFTFFV